MKKIAYLLVTITALLATLGSAWAVEVNIYFPPAWKNQSEKAARIAEGLSQEVGIKITPHIAECYPEILNALLQKQPVLAYVGSMVQSIVYARQLGTPLIQALNHKQLYSGIMLFPKGMSPTAILNDYPAEIAFTVGATSGEVCAKLATGGKASIAVSDHHAAAEAIRTGKAKAGFVKNIWWEENKNNYPKLDSYSLPGISEVKNADNVLLSSRFVSPDVKAALMSAAFKLPELFDADLVVPFDSSALNFTIELMNKAGIDPLTYRWPADDSDDCLAAVAATQVPAVSSSQHEAILLDGKTIMESNCGKCHLLDKVRKYRRKSRKQWELTVARKIGMGLKLTAEQQAALINYLVSLNPNKN
jgi:ABC-type phosphate/phosphonate transport system substrate-binding protein